MALTPFDQALLDEGVLGTPLEPIARKTRGFESGGNPNAVSNRGARGGMQVMPGTFTAMADKGWDIGNDYHNARAGIRYLREGWDKSGGDTALTGAYYYGGPGGMDKARRGEAVFDPMNPNKPSTLQYGQRLADAVNGQTGQYNKQVGSMGNNFDFNGVYQQALQALGPTKPSPEAIKMFAQNNSDRAANLPLAIASMMSRDNGVNRAGNTMYDDAVLAGRPMAMGDAGWVGPDGQFVASPDAEMRGRQHALTMTMAQMDKARVQANSDRDYGVKVDANRIANDANNRKDINEGPSPSEGLNGVSPQPQPSTVLPRATGQTPGLVTAQPVPAPQVSSLPRATGQMPPAQTSVQAVPGAQPPAPGQVQPPAGQEQQPPADRRYVKSIGQGAPRIGKASDDSGDVYAGPGGGEYILDPKTQQYYIRPEGVNVIKDRLPLPAEKVETMSGAYTNLEKLGETANSFKLGYGGSKLDALGNVENWVGSRNDGSKFADQAAWWQNWNTYFNGVIKSLSGSSVTKNEADRLAATAISPGMDPKFIQRRIVEIQQDVARSYNNLHSHYGGEGYTVDGFKKADYKAPSAGGNFAGVTIERGE